MRQISVYLDDRTEEQLNIIMTVNNCTISDAVCMGLFMVPIDKPSIVLTQSLYDKVKIQIQKKFGTVDKFLSQYNIERNTLTQVCRQIEAGATICGFGTKRSKAQTPKTKTAWCVYCLKEYCGIDLGKE